MKYAPTHVLGIDQARASGWSLVPLGLGLQRPHSYGLAVRHPARVQALQVALSAVQDIAKLLVVFEDHSKISLTYGNNRGPGGKHCAPKRNTAGILGLGAARGRWDELLDELGHPEKLRISVPMDDWRMRVLGCSNKPGSEELKERAKRWAMAHTQDGICDDNVAEAICIAAWGTLDGLSVLQHGRKEERVKARVKRAATKQIPMWGAR